MIRVLRKILEHSHNVFFKDVPIFFVELCRGVKKGVQLKEMTPIKKNKT